MVAYRGNQFVVKTSGGFCGHFTVNNGRAVARRTSRLGIKNMSKNHLSRTRAKNTYSRLRFQVSSLSLGDEEPNINLAAISTVRDGAEQLSRTT